MTHNDSQPTSVLVKWSRTVHARSVDSPTLRTECPHWVTTLDGVTVAISQLTHDSILLKTSDDDDDDDDDLVLVLILLTVATDEARGA